MKAEKNDKAKPEITEAVCGKSWPRGYKTFFILNSVEHEIYPDHKG